ncbi:MAG: ComF family protein [Firmicutes bacterium]|nr:ComF family protein [Bacillota bacterium]
MRIFFQKLFKLFYPPLPTCVACGATFTSLYPLAFCQGCLDRIPFITKPVCSRCDRPLRGGDRDPCRECQGETYYFEQAMAVAVYDGYMRELLHSAKYNFRPDLARGLGTILAVWAENETRLEEIDAVIPVPLHPEKLATRGYNQTELMAEPLAVALRRPLYTEVLQRVKPTVSQSKLSRREREENTRNAFAVVDCPAVAGKEVLLIDDIRTTGYTLSAAARALLVAGARRVKALTMAVGVTTEQWKG